MSSGQEDSGPVLWVFFTTVWEEKAREFDFFTTWSVHECNWAAVSRKEREWENNTDKKWRDERV